MSFLLHAVWAGQTSCTPAAGTATCFCQIRRRSRRRLQAGTSALTIGCQISSAFRFSLRTALRNAAAMSLLTDLRRAVHIGRCSGGCPLSLPGISCTGMTQQRSGNLTAAAPMAEESARSADAWTLSPATVVNGAESLLSSPIRYKTAVYTLSAQIAQSPMT